MDDLYHHGVKGQKMSNYIISNGELHKADELRHWKYLYKKMINGKWRYFYKKDSSDKKEKGFNREEWLKEIKSLFDKKEKKKISSDNLRTVTGHKKDGRNVITSEPVYGSMHNTKKTNTVTTKSGKKMKVTSSRTDARISKGQQFVWEKYHKNDKKRKAPTVGETRISYDQDGKFVKNKVRTTIKKAEVSFPDKEKKRNRNRRKA